MSHSDHHSDHDAVHETDTVGDKWDRRYSEMAELWSGEPNATLVKETRGLRPGRALDVGCGEGADAIWLADEGWKVTALDVSKVALDRAAAQAVLVGVQVRWLHSGLVEAGLAPRTFELVTAQYPALPRTEDNAAERALMDAVALGGTLLIVHHPVPADAEANSHGFNLRDYVGPSHVAALLGDNWEIEVDETRPRHVATGAGSHHTEDVILRARRLG